MRGFYRGNLHSVPPYGGWKRYHARHSAWTETLETLETLFGTRRFLPQQFLHQGQEFGVGHGARLAVVDADMVFPAEGPEVG